MAKQQMKASKKFIQLKGFYTTILKHRVIVGLILISLLIGAIVGNYSYSQYLYKFSSSDFGTIEVMAKEVLVKVGGQNIAANHSCSYNRPGEFDNLHLFCSVELVAYLSFQDEAQAKEVAHKYENSIVGLFGQTPFRLSNFYDHPHDSSDVVIVTIKGRQCQFYIESNRFAKEAATFLPPKTNDDLIALLFSCSAESRAEYFPVTYRQG